MFAGSLAENPHIHQTCVPAAEARQVSAGHPLYPSWSLMLSAESLSCYHRVNAPRELSEGSVLYRVQQLTWHCFRKTTNQGWEKGKFKA